MLIPSQVLALNGSKYSVNSSVECAPTNQQSSSNCACSNSSPLPSPVAATTSPTSHLPPTTSIRPVGRIVTGIVTIDLDHPKAILDASQTLGAGIDGHKEGEGETIFSLANIRRMRSAGLKPLAYRLRTELGVEAWHWNPQGTWSDPSHQQGYWLSSIHSKKPLLESYGYRLPRRGDTLDEANNDGYSRLDDGNSKTFWKSNPYLTSHYTGEPDRKHPQWVVLDFGKPVFINAVRLHWREPYAKKFRIQFANEGAVYFGHHRPWHDFPQGKREQGHGGEELLSLGEVKKFGKRIPIRFLRVLMTESSATAPPSCHDPRDMMGYAIQEIEAGEITRDGVFHDHVIHRPDNQQTLVYVSSTDPWHRASDRDEKTEQPGFDLIVSSRLAEKNAILWSLPVLYDTPENSAAAVRFLQQRGYLSQGVSKLEPVLKVAEADEGRGVGGAQKLSVQQLLDASSTGATKPFAAAVDFENRFLELGEEPDGQRIDPNDFGALYCQTARLIRKIDPSISLGGPSFVTIDCQPNDTTYRFDHRSWLQRFFKQLRKKNQKKDFQFLTFEWYPFDDICLDPASLLTQEPLQLQQAVKRIRRGGVPPSMPLMITEYGYSVFEGQPEVELAAALLNTDISAQFLLLGGKTSYLYGYEPNSLACLYGNSWGNLMMFLQNKRGGIKASLPTYYAARLLTQEWMAPLAGTHQIYPTVTNLKDKKGRSLVTAYTLQRPDHQWSLLIVNKSPDQACCIQCHFLHADRKVPSPWKSPRDLYSYSPVQYQWHVDGPHGHPSRNREPAHSSLKEEDPIIILPWSITVILFGQQAE
ncbi:MAG TPA: discoidin domain-containing protein [Chthoniobacterales bacterium]|nr:discoidin domain-containing protein [Chthoniobacterales bacterium]